MHNLGDPYFRKPPNNQWWLIFDYFSVKIRGRTGKCTAAIIQPWEQFAQDIHEVLQTWDGNWYGSKWKIHGSRGPKGVFEQVNHALPRYSMASPTQSTLPQQNLVRLTRLCWKYLEIMVSALPSVPVFRDFRYAFLKQPTLRPITIWKI